jgi:hypothetical protein
MCPECGSEWDYEHERCTSNCQNIEEVIECQD